MVATVEQQEVKTTGGSPPVSSRRRTLVKGDLTRMCLPKRYWNVNCAGVSDVKDHKETRSPRDIVTSYISDIDSMKSQGLGLLLWSANGTGKTSIAAVIAKEYRRRYSTVLFVEAASLKSKVIGNEHFDDDETYWQRANSVDVLVLDDLGKGTQDKTGFGERLIDELIRTRNANKLVTIITTNAAPRGSGETLSDILKPSTLHSLKEHVMAINVRGEDKREQKMADEKLKD